MLISLTLKDAQMCFMAYLQHSQAGTRATHDYVHTHSNEIKNTLKHLCEFVYFLPLKILLAVYIFNLFCIYLAKKEGVLYKRTES